ncbi:uncharacterized protein F4812DRAFT_416061 [Daldinia caldariorum]|uniref:uncharacterized protein n=1 Tax=Daldinia caldariorum TaxID=326644 RepID=UPI00200892BF|nr:uncharacterized protein F4812DRAFT_416061 [Daldinia caldariorum]KAI1471928.1 hypothetical protein F4812DRAFT_416061 [Daldinia caldariorum]
MHSLTHMPYLHKYMLRTQHICHITQHSTAQHNNYTDFFFFFKKKTMARMPKFYSPYGPRPKRSAQLIAVWMAILVFALAVTFYLTGREGGATLTPSYAGMGKVVDEVGKEKVKGEGERKDRFGGRRGAKMVP